MKTCKSCLQTLALPKFGINSGYKDKFQPRCRDCHNQHSRNNRTMNKQQYLSVKQQWRQANMDRLKQQRLEAYANNPERFRNTQLKYRARKKESGLCRRCQSQPVGQSVYCFSHYVYASVSALINRIDKTRTNLRESLVAGLIAKFKLGMRCPFIGEELIPGITLSLDHKIPQARCSDLALDLNNLQWVSLTYNRAKQNMTDEEFATKYRLIALDSNL